MKVSKHVTRSTEVEINGEQVDLEITFEPSSIMDYREQFFKVSPNGDKVVLGYLVDDQDCENPLERSDGEGRIFSRDDRGENLAAFYEAFGFDRYGDPDVDESEVEERYVAQFIEGATAEKFDEVFEREVDDGEIESDEAFVKRCSRLEFDEYPDTAISESKMDEIREAMRLEKADPLAVPLDVYEHSGISYSVSGEGMQDRWDTARCGAVWVPDDCARENIEIAALQKLLPEGVKVEYLSSEEKAADLVGMDVKYTLPDGTVQQVCGSFLDGVKAASKALGVEVGDAELKAAMKEVATDYARGVAETYTRWCNGETYGYSVDTYSRDADGNWELDENAASWGFIGDEYAMESMQEQAEYFAGKQAEMDVTANSLDAAVKVADSKESWSLATAENPVEGKFSGSVMAVKDRHTVLNLGRTALVVENACLDKLVEQGAMVDMVFAGGKGSVQVAMEKGGVER